MYNNIYNSAAILDFFSNVSISHFLVLSSLIFSIGFIGVCINRKNLINLLMSIELMILASSINFVAFSRYFKDINGHIFVVFILAVAAAESAIGLGIILNYFRNKKSIEINKINSLKN